MVQLRGGVANLKGIMRETILWYNICRAEQSSILLLSKTVAEEQTAARRVTTTTASETPSIRSSSAVVDHIVDRFMSNHFFVEED
jgi:hypothetical protein